MSDRHLWHSAGFTITGDAYVTIYVSQQKVHEGGVNTQDLKDEFRVARGALEEKMASNEDRMKAILQEIVDRAQIPCSLDTKCTRIPIAIIQRAAELLKELG